MNKVSGLLVVIRHYEIIVASVVILLVIFLLSLFYLIPNFSRAQQIFSQQKGLKKNIEILKQKDTALSSLDYEQYKDIFLKLNQVLPESKDYVSLFSSFDDLEKKTGVTIVRTDFQFGVISTTSAKLTKAPGSSAYMVPVLIEVAGTISSIQKFIDSLNSLSGRLITLNDAQWNIKQNNIRISFNGKAYFYPQPLTIGSLDTPLPKLSKDQEELIKKVALVKLAKEEIEPVNVGKKNLFQ